MALAGVTGGELRIKETVPEDLRMIRLVFERLGLRSNIAGHDVVVPGGQRLVVQAESVSTRARSRMGRGPPSRRT